MDIYSSDENIWSPKLEDTFDSFSGLEYFNEIEVDILYYDLNIDCEEIIAKEESESKPLNNLISISTNNLTENTVEKFIKFVEAKEITYHSKSYCKKYFDPSKFPSTITNIVNMSQDDIWNIDCAYGLTFQAFLAQENNLDLPCLKKRKRKLPILAYRSKGSQTMKKICDKDPIYEELCRNCNQKSIDSLKRKSPRDQILLHVFVIDLLLHPYYRYCIQWKNKKELSFEITNSRVVAHIWMTIKGNDTCSYEHFARGIRFKRGNGKMFTKTEKRNKCVYQLTKYAISDYKKRRNKNDLTKRLLTETFSEYV